ncbi:MAG: glycosyl transferase family 2, partial [Anaerolineales bacterium]
MLTIFSPPKPFQGKIDVIQRNAIESWIALGDEVEIVLVGDELGLADVAAEYGVGHVEDVARNKYGTPLLDDI